jgi:hypothetical protein
MVTALAGCAYAAQASASLGVPKLPRASAFAGSVTNTWFPLAPGTVYLYRGEKDGHQGIDRVTVMHRRRAILGIPATVVQDRLIENGHVVERTTDWYAQDRAGNVWYLGERTATLTPAGTVISTDGSWRAGVDGARAGIYMPAHPTPGQAARQEYYRGHAEDQFRVLSLNVRVRSPATSSDHALLTQETTRLEPGVLDHKVYVRGIGTVVEQTIRGGREKWVLQSVSHR